MLTKPGCAGREPTSGVLVTLAGLLDGFESCFQLRLWRVLAIVTQKKGRIVRLTGVATAKRVGVIVNKCEPGGVKVELGYVFSRIGLGWQADCEPDQGWPNAKHVAHG